MISDLVAIPVVLATLGFVGIYTGWKRRRIHGQMADARTRDVRELATPETVEIEGEALPDDDPVTAPVTGREAVVAAWTVEEWDERGDTSTWREVARGVESTTFEIGDGTGRVRVVPISKRDTAGKWTQTTGVSASEGVRIDDVLAEFESFPVRTTVEPDETPPDGIQRLHDDHDLYTDTGSVANVVDVGRKHGQRRYAEAIVEPGETAYVLGRVEGRDDPDRERFHPEDAVVTEPDDGLFVVSDQGEDSLESEFDAAARTRMVAGAVAAVLGVAGTAYLLWPV